MHNLLYSFKNSNFWIVIVKRHGGLMLKTSGLRFCVLESEWPLIVTAELFLWTLFPLGGGSPYMDYTPSDMKLSSVHLLGSYKLLVISFCRIKRFLNFLSWMHHYASNDKFWYINRPAQFVHGMSRSRCYSAQQWTRLCGTTPSPQSMLNSL